MLEVDGRPRGYAIYRVKGDWDERGPRNEVTVVEVTGLDPAAERALWEWLATIDLVARIKGWRMPVPHPLFLQLEDLSRLGLVVGDGIWLRLIDLPAALEGRSYEGSGVTTLEVTDEFVPANAGRWRVEVTGGTAIVSPTGDAPDLALDTTALASAYLGGFTFAELFRAGRVGECREGAIADADGLFRTNALAWCSHAVLRRAAGARSASLDLSPSLVPCASYCLTSKPDSPYADTATSYEYPARYRRFFEPLLNGEPMIAIIYEPRSGGRGRMSYVGWAALRGVPVRSPRVTDSGQPLWEVALRGSCSRTSQSSAARLPGRAPRALASRNATCESKRRVIGGRRSDGSKEDEGRLILELGHAASWAWRPTIPLSPPMVRSWWPRGPAG